MATTGEGQTSGSGPLDRDSVDEVSRTIFHLTALSTSRRAEIYRRYVVDPEVDRQKVEIDLERLALQALDLQGQERLMDAGTGNGEFVEVIADSGHQGEIIGLDYSALGFEAIRKKLAKGSDSNVSFIQGNVRNLHTFPASSIDKISAKNLLHHVGNPGEALKEFRRVLVPEGTLVSLHRGSLNLARHWRFVQRVVEEFGFEPPPSPYLNFDAEAAPHLINNEGFETIPFPPFDDLPGEGESTLIRPLAIDIGGWDLYGESILSFARANILVQSRGGEEPEALYTRTRELVRSLARSAFRKEIKESTNGRFIDFAQDRLVVSRSTKKAHHADAEEPKPA